MISPFRPSGEVDQPAVGRIVQHLLENRIGGIFPLGTTGEAASMTASDKRLIVQSVVQANASRATIYAGISSNSFRESIDAAKEYKSIGADAVVAHVPGCYPLDDPEIESYFLKLADGVSLPLVIYNIPLTTRHQIALDVVSRLRRHENIVAIKDSSGDAVRLVELLRSCGGRDGWPVLVGTSTQFTTGLMNGAAGLVPSGAQLAPDLYQRMYEAAANAKWDQVQQLQRETDSICQQYLKGKSLGQGLAMLKALLEKQGLCGRTMLPPLRDHAGDV
jgi:4-hydroxy-tetrahydrodipicolinate synthase